MKKKFYQIGSVVLGLLLLAPLSFAQPSDGSMMLARTENRKICEKNGGEYLGNGICAFQGFNEQYCDKKQGIYRNDECLIDVKYLCDDYFGGVCF